MWDGSSCACDMRLLLSLGPAKSGHTIPGERMGRPVVAGRRLADLPFARSEEVGVISSRAPCGDVPAGRASRGWARLPHSCTALSAGAGPDVRCGGRIRFGSGLLSHTHGGDRHDPDQGRPRAGARAGLAARLLDARRRAPLLALRRRRARRLSARPGDPAAPRRLARSRGRAGVAAHRGQARGAGHPRRAAADRRAGGSRPRPHRGGRARAGRRARPRRRADRPLHRGAGASEAAGGPRPGAQGAGLFLPRDRRDHGLDVYEGQSLPDRRPPRVPRPLRRDRGRARVRAVGAGAVRPGRRGGFGRRRRGAAAALASLPVVSRQPARVPDGADRGGGTRGPRGDRRPGGAGGRSARRRWRWRWPEPRRPRVGRRRRGPPRASGAVVPQAARGNRGRVRGEGRGGGRVRDGARRGRGGRVAPGGGDTERPCAPAVPRPAPPRADADLSARPGRPGAGSGPDTIGSRQLPTLLRTRGPRNGRPPRRPSSPRPRKCRQPSPRRPLRLQAPGRRPPGPHPPSRPRTRHPPSSAPREAP